ncbi:MAG: carboxymuconolactone decarboxylase family protein [Dehalococcoidia bacterium]|nr:carboxymuconolactone decarboxylase family protein [Dehalococcoidia bacterium]
MARLSDVTRDQLAPEHQEFFDSIASSRGSVRGPYGVLLHSPDLAARVAHTGAYVRFDLDISEAHREIIICATAREIRQQYEFSAHARLARQAGVSEDVVNAIATGKAPEGLSGIEASLVKYVQELSQNHKISDDTFNAVSGHFGMQKTVEITALIGHYLLVGQILSAFEVDLPDGVQPEIT